MLQAGPATCTFQSSNPYRMNPDSQTARQTDTDTHRQTETHTHMIIIRSLCSMQYTGSARTLPSSVFELLCCVDATEEIPPVLHGLKHKAGVQSYNSPNRGRSLQEQAISSIWMSYACNATTNCLINKKLLVCKLQCLLKGPDRALGFTRLAQT